MSDLLHDPSSDSPEPGRLERVLKLYAHRPMHPDSVRAMVAQRRTWIMYVVYGLCMAGLVFKAIAFGPMSLWVDFGLTTTVLIAPGAFIWAERSHWQQLLRRSELVWTHVPEQAKEQLLAFQSAYKPRQFELIKKYKRAKFSALFTGTGAGMIVVLILIMDTFQLDAWLWLKGSSSGVYVFLMIMLCMLFGGLGVLTGAFAFFLKGQMRTLRGEREHLQSFAPELFTEEQLKGALSFDEDDELFKGALTQKL